MVKNEEKNLDRCLKSLQNLRSLIENELIIIDTGSDDRTIEIALQYTEKLFHHSWTNNFSEMRNKSISYAKGEWIFIIDADEELVDDTELINFLKMKNTQPRAIALNLKNVIHSSGRIGAIVITMRLFKNDGKFHYVGAVHNIPVVNGQVINVKSTLYHYGYVSDDKDLMEKKFIRTSELLLKELEKDENNIYYLYQLGSSYDMHNQNDKAELYFKRAYEKAKEQGVLLENIYIYGSYVKLLISNRKYELTRFVSTEGLSYEKDYIDLMYFNGMACILQKDYIEGISMLENYLNKVENFDSLPISLNPSIQHFTISSKDEVNTNLATAYYEIQKLDKAITKAGWVLDNISLDSRFYNIAINVYINSSFELNDFDSIISLYERFDQSRWNGLDDILYNKICNLNWDDTDNNAIKIFSNLKSKLGMLIYYRLNDKKIDLDISLINECFYRGYDESLYLMISMKMNISDLLYSQNELSIMKMLSSLNEKYKEFKVLVNEYISNFNFNESITDLNTLRILKKFIGLVTLDNPQLMLAYFEVGIRFIKQKYSAEFLSCSQMYGYLNAEEQLLSMLNWAQLNLGQLTKNNVSNAIELFPEWSNSIYQWYDSILNKEDFSSDEMDSLLENLMFNIIVLIESANIDEALYLIDEYLKYKPDDLDMILKKSELMLLN